MGKTKLDKVYEASGDAEMRAAYDDWADEYDAEVEANGYLTPGRVSQALARFSQDKTAPVLDFGCGTGLSGAALKAEGFGTIDGADLSAKMLEVAKGRGVYRALELIEPDTGLHFDLGVYRAITAIGVIGKGAAPASVYPTLVAGMEPGALLAFSMNDLTINDPEYAHLVRDSIDRGQVRLLCDEHGPHLAKYGKNSGATVYVLERLG